MINFITVNNNFREYYNTYTEAGYQNGVEIEKRGGNVCVISASPTSRRG